MTANKSRGVCRTKNLLVSYTFCSVWRFSFLLRVRTEYILNREKNILTYITNWLSEREKYVAERSNICNFVEKKENSRRHQVS